MCQLQTFLFLTFCFIAHKEKKNFFKGVNVQEWHRHDGLLKALSVNVEVALAEVCSPWNADDPLLDL